MDGHDPLDPVAVYLREVVMRIEPLTAAEEAMLFRELRGTGSLDKVKENAERRLMESQLALVVTVARKQSKLGLPVVELIQEGNIALLGAVRSFAKNPIGDFTAYAAKAIEEAITTRRYMKSSK
jgi:DNA-directed RNA polymerase sigma subunit (sigma70/sigma32)